MTDFTKLDPETRSYALVGKFLFEWAYLELEIRRAIGKALDLDMIKLAIITSNIQLRDKIHILRTAVHHSVVYPEKERDRVKKILVEIIDYSKIRNMMAHDAFIATKDGEVMFYVMKAKGQIQIPDEIWGIEKFEESYGKISTFVDEVRGIVEQIEINALAEAFRAHKSSEPNAGSIGLGLLGDLFHPPLDSPGSDIDPSNQQTASRTPPSEKE